MKPGGPGLARCQHGSPESEGFSRERLEVLRRSLRTHPTDAMRVLSRGYVVFEYGNTNAAFFARSRCSKE
jgi:hypothetical protein